MVIDKLIFDEVSDFPFKTVHVESRVRLRQRRSGDRRRLHRRTLPGLARNFHLGNQTVGETSTGSVKIF
jgi:hypothetical protein